MARETSNEEILKAVSKGFSRVEKRLGAVEDSASSLDKKIDGVEQRLGQKIDGVRSSLDAEILRRVDDNAELDKRISKLEGLHGLEA